MVYTTNRGWKTHNSWKVSSLTISWRPIWWRRYLDILTTTTMMLLCWQRSCLVLYIIDTRRTPTLGCYSLQTAFFGPFYSSSYQPSYYYWSYYWLLLVIFGLIGYSWLFLVNIIGYSPQTAFFGPIYSSSYQPSYFSLPTICLAVHPFLWAIFQLNFKPLVIQSLLKSPKKKMKLWKVSWKGGSVGTECIFQFQSELNKIKGIFCWRESFYVFFKSFFNCLLPQVASFPNIKIILDSNRDCLSLKRNQFDKYVLGCANIAIFCVQYKLRFSFLAKCCFFLCVGVVGLSFVERSRIGSSFPLLSAQQIYFSIFIDI